MTGAHRWRPSFPVYRAHPGIAYLDSACMSLTPTPVLEAMEQYYREYPGCAGRSLHRFSEEVGQRFEATREELASFFGAAGADRVVFLRNATEAINLVAQGLDWKPGERVLITDQEHNSNLVVWQRLARERGLRVEVLELADDGQWEPESLERALARGVRLVSVFHTSNLDGRTLPVREIVERAHDRGTQVLIDGSQAAPHQRIDLARLGVDYYALSGHKMLGPTGTGLLLGAPERLEPLRPLVSGGETVEWTTLEAHALRPPPHRFEAGLQNYAGVLGLGAAIRFLRRAGPREIAQHDRSLNDQATRELAGEPGLRLLGPAAARQRPSILAFDVQGVNPHDIALFLDSGYGVLVRSGQHCVHSWYSRHGLTGNVRASFYLYNDRKDVERLTRGVRELLGHLRGSHGPPRRALRAGDRRPGRNGARRRSRGVPLGR